MMQLINDTSEKKLRGGYYTPSEIARFLLDWGMSNLENPDIIEPSCGSGIFLEQLRISRKNFSSFIGIEYNQEEAKKASSIKLAGANVLAKDFHEYCLTTNKRFDLAIGNPPFIRYQYYDKKFQQLASTIFYNAGMKFSKLTNAWVSFVVGCALLLKNKGKMAFVVPSEILQVTYAKQLRIFLSSFFNKINIITFRNLVFENIQQNVILLLCEKNGSKQYTIHYQDINDISDLCNFSTTNTLIENKINPKSDKWTYYFLQKNEISFVENLISEKLPHIYEYANVEVGITTGANQYFSVPQSIVDEYKLYEFAKPMIGRSVQVKSIEFTDSDWKTNILNGSRANLLIFNDIEAISKNKFAQNYIKLGEHQGINKGYKTRIRDYWYAIPSIKKSDALFVRRNHYFPRLILNSIGAYSTDTMHRVFINSTINKKAFVASYYNSFSFVQAEIAGRNFGGGALELMPSEVSTIFLPYNIEFENLFYEIDNMIRTDFPIDKILDYTDSIILKKYFGYSDNDIRIGRKIWHKLTQRRMKR